MNDDMVEPLRPEPLTPAQGRARRVQQRAFVVEQQQAGRIPIPGVTPTTPPPEPVVAPPFAPPSRAPAVIPPAPWARRAARGQPAGKRFETHELRRIPVAVTSEAQALLVAGSSQSRLFAQALGEVLGEHPDLARVTVEAVDKDALFGPSHAGQQVLRIAAYASLAEDALPEHVWHINADALSDLHPMTRLPRFNAERAARALLNLYRDHTARQA